MEQTSDINSSQTSVSLLEGLQSQTDSQDDSSVSPHDPDTKVSLSIEAGQQESYFMLQFYGFMWWVKLDSVAESVMKNNS